MEENTYFWMNDNIGKTIHLKVQERSKQLEKDSVWWEFWTSGVFEKGISQAITVNSEHHWLITNC